MYKHGSSPLLCVIIIPIFMMVLQGPYGFCSDEQSPTGHITSIHIHTSDRSQQLMVTFTQCSPTTSINKENGFIHTTLAFSACRIDMQSASFSSGPCFQEMNLQGKEHETRLDLRLSPLCISKFIRSSTRIGIQATKTFFTWQEKPDWFFPLKPGDELEITIGGTIPFQASVDANGDLIVPVAGKFHVASHSLPWLKKELIRALKNVQSSKKIQLKIRKTSPRILSIQHGSGKAKIFRMHHPSTLTDILHRIGTSLQEIQTIILKRTLPDGSQAQIEVSSSSPLMDTVLNVWLEDHDTIVLTRPSYVFLDGAVLSPGPYVWYKGLTLKTLLDDAGGMTNVQKAQIYILRKKHGKIVTQSFQWDELKTNEIIDPELEPGDIIRVQVFEREPSP